MKEALKVNTARPTGVRQYGSCFFEGACADTGAQKTVCGLEQTKAYCRAHKQAIKLTTSPYSYKFGNGVRTNLGMPNIRMCIHKGRYSQFWVDVVDADIPLLLGLELLDKHMLVADNVENVLVSKVHSWKIPIIRAHGHLFVRWNIRKIMYTRSALEQLHLHFFYPSKQKLLSLLKRDTPDRVTKDTPQVIQVIVDK